jgi:hypothetical protein
MKWLITMEDDSNLEDRFVEGIKLTVNSNGDLFIYGKQEAITGDTDPVFGFAAGNWSSFELAIDYNGFIKEELELIG